MRRFRHLLVLAGALLVARAPLAAAQCDIPLIIGSGGSTANVLILMDNSDSMNDIIYHDAYNPAVNYSGNFLGGLTYNISADGWYEPRDFWFSYPLTPSAYLVNSDFGKPGQYKGNYLNWVYFHATATQRSEIPNYTRIQAAKAVINAVLAGVTSVRFSVEVFNGGNGGTIISPFGTDLATTQTAVTNVVTDTWTPLGESMETALNYYTRTDSTAPFQASCQKSFVILVTDGMPTQDTNVSAYLRANDCANNDPTTNCTSLGTGYPNFIGCPGYLDNVTCYMYRNDLRADLEGIQNVATYVIGFGISGQFLQTAANEGGGEYYSTNNVAGLVAALSQAFISIGKRVAAGASVAVVTAEDRINNRLFRARYESGSWRGYVESFTLPFQSGSPPLWEAGALLAARDPDDRNIYTSTNGTNTYDFVDGNKTTLRPLLGAVDDNEADDIIDYIRGQAESGTRDREGWILGDVVDAAPVAVGKPTGFNSLPGYSAFRTAHANRGEVLYVGGNDGMLHCFDTTDGEELWAYIPKTQLPRLSALMDVGYCHQYFVNTTPVVYDVKIGGNWRTVLFGGEEGSTNGLFALDVTDPTPGNMSVLWDVSLSGLRGSWNTPTLVRDVVSNGHVLCVGTGYSAAAVRDTLIALNPATGAVINRIDLGSAVAGNKTSRATAVDTDFNGFDDLLYINDLAGRLWRVDLRNNPWTKTLLFSSSQPIQAPPVVTINSMGRPMVFFGTGRFLTGSDPSTTTQQSIYAIIDDGSGTAYTPADLVNQTSTINAVTGGSHGWYIDLVQSAGERVNRSAALIAGKLYIPSFRPSTETCAGGGQSWLYTLDYKDGSAPNNADGSENNTTAGRVQSMGDGMLADPTVDLVNEAILLQSSNAVVMSETVTGGLKKLVLRGWHQKWN